MPIEPMDSPASLRNGTPLISSHTTSPCLLRIWDSYNSDSPALRASVRISICSLSAGVINISDAFCPNSSSSEYPTMAQNLGNALVMRSCLSTSKIPRSMFSMMPR